MSGMMPEQDSAGLPLPCQSLLHSLSSKPNRISLTMPFPFPTGIQITCRISLKIQPPRLGGTFPLQIPGMSVSQRKIAAKSAVRIGKQPSDALAVPSRLLFPPQTAYLIYPVFPRRIIGMIAYGHLPHNLRSSPTCRLPLFFHKNREKKQPQNHCAKQHNRQRRAAIVFSIPSQYPVPHKAP